MKFLQGFAMLSISLSNNREAVTYKSACRTNVRQALLYKNPPQVPAFSDRMDNTLKEKIVLVSVFVLFGKTMAFKH